jgi:purine-binding chemotaxis protein CheW
MNASGDESELEHENTTSYVVFHLGSESYVVDVTRVHEVLDAASLTAVPGGSRALVGLHNLRGQIVPVWDLRVPFGLAANETDPGRAPSVLVVEPDPSQPSRLAGLRVDRVSDVLEFGADHFQPTPSLGLGAGSAFVRGLVRYQDRFLLVLDLDRVFAALNPTTNSAVV